VQKDFGKWTTYGGGGYGINPGPGNRDYWLFGWQLERQITDHLILGAELFHQTAFTAGEPGSVGFPLGNKATTGFNLGGKYDFSKNLHLLFSAGRGVQNATGSNQFSYYLGFQWTFRVNYKLRLGCRSFTHRIRSNPDKSPPRLISPARSELVCQRLKWPVP
jgi:hypothetical protein